MAIAVVIAEFQNKKDNMFISSRISKEDNVLLYKYFLGVRYIDAFKSVFRRPNSLFIEHSQGCNLSCSYCYAEVWNDTHKTVSPIEIEKLAKEFKFNSYSIYGGDAFNDWKLIKNVIERVVSVTGKKIDNIVISSNGIAVSEDKFQFLIENCENIDLQISMEPEYFNQRKSKNNIHQNILLIKKVDIIKDFYRRIGKNITVSAVLPDELLCVDKSFDFTLNTIKNFWNADRINISWKLEETKDRAIPDYLNNWIKEESYTVLDPSCTHTRIWQSLVNSGLNKIIMTLDGEYNANEDAKVFSFNNCNAATGSLSIGPDSNLYACHQAAITGDKSQALPELSPRYMWEKITRPALKIMHNDTCSSCICQYTCGGICFYHDVDIKCIYQRQIQDLAMQVLKIHFPKIYANIDRKYNKFIEYFNKNKEDHIELINTPFWKSMLDDTVSKEEMLEFINSTGGNMDTSVLGKMYADL